MDTLSLIPLAHVAELRAMELTMALLAPSAAMLICLGLTALAGAAGARTGTALSFRERRAG